MAIKTGAVLILVGLLLTACASQQERAAKRAAAEQAAGVDRANRCASFGYKLGTPDYSHCLENMYVQDQQKAAAEELQRQAKVEAVANGLQQAGAAMSAIGQPPPSPAPMFNQPVRCNTIGSTTTCQ